ncbi:GTPase HflX [Chelativorans sp. ZYF759]|uniref:GTPase HflX n=1 Tax=Chelativorans sp. ZYF759 TaxID=2692213 RepID=UPI00145C9A50|nr:GTPase HflX [Chelativorans sp. ZYF759]NMG38486.1 GTPase HflX [Chelativorans sp. ZYF759]
MANDIVPDTYSTESVTARAVIIVPILPQQFRDSARATERTAEARLEEAIGLACAIDLDPVHCEVVTVSSPRAATLIGTGKLAELAEIVKEAEAELVVVDHALSPVQQRNLEKELHAKVLDRTGLILEIFGRRARTREGRLQVDLAHLEYQRGRLVRSWTHLERQRGGGGFMGGPGETQIEADRRQLQERITRLKRELEQVRRTRDLHRSKRRKVPHPIVALVGYTNAGKSTLFNRLTGAGVMARDMLFATLDPTLRRVHLPHGTEVIFSDTVGFISDLPTHLVAAFRATLEEVIEADLVIHLRDIADPDTAAQAEDVVEILSDLGVERDNERVLEVWNKIDLLDADQHDHIVQASGSAQAIAVSAITGEGVDTLLSEIERRIAGTLESMDLSLSPDQHGELEWIYRNAEVLARTDREDGGVDVRVRAPETACRRIRERVAATSRPAPGGPESV